MNEGPVTPPAEGHAPAKWRARAPFAVAVFTVVLALFETINALIAPLRAPSDADWQSAAASVRASFRPGDLIVAAPEWAGQVMRLHLGELVPVWAAARLDAARFGRIWEVSQRGARAPEGRAGRLVSETNHGALTVRLHEQTAAPVSYDFFAHALDARVTRLDAGAAVPCARLADRHECPGIPDNFVRARVAEVDTQQRRALVVPMAASPMAIEWTDVPLGRELAVGAGLHSVWIRRHSQGKVLLRAIIDGQEVGRQVAGNRTGWRVESFDTSRWAGKRATVRFEVSAADPSNRVLAFTAEARG